MTMMTARREELAPILLRNPIRPTIKHRYHIGQSTRRHVYCEHTQSNNNQAMMVSARLFCIALLLVVAASSSRAEEQPHRQESQKPAYKLAGFEPTSLITDEAAIDQDQRLMVNLMSKGTKEDFLQAWRVYQDGAFSRPYALITLEKPLTQRVKIGTNITGRTTEGVYLNCEALVSADVGETTLKVRYRGTESLDPNTRCAVGANPNPITNGCKCRV
jgi:hypothetical protein